MNTLMTMRPRPQTAQMTRPTLPQSAPPAPSPQPPRSAPPAPSMPPAQNAQSAQSAPIAQPRQTPSGSTQSILRARAVMKSYGEGALATKVLHGVSLDVRAGELTLLMGPSGSGKTTLISILAGLLRPTSGAVEMCGAPITTMSEGDVARVRRGSVGFVFQSYNLFPALTALENVAEVLRMKGASGADANAKARAALTTVGLADRLDHRPRELSGGQKQRVAIARALAGEPALIVGDEVTSALDGTTALAVMDILRRYVSPRTAVVLVTHDHRMERFADRVIEMEDGVMVRDRAIRGAYRASLRVAGVHA